MSKQIIIYTDGACSGNPGSGGWGAVVMYKDHQKELSGYEDNTTNNRMEIMAAISALESLKEPCIVDIFTDSQYVKRGITEWINGWIKNNWINAQKKPVKNQDLWQRLLKANSMHTVNWNWVKGHSDNEFNIRADELARNACKQKSTS